MDRDAILDITVSDDRMQVEGIFYPAIENGRPMSPDYVDSVLENARVVDGIDGEAIAEAMFTCNTDNRAVEGVIVARGVTPVAERPAYWNVRDPKADGTPNSQSAKRIDYKGITHLEVVHAGERVAERIEKREGVVGTDVFGNELPFTTESVPAYEPGERIRIEGDFAVAEVGGQIVVTQSTFSVIDRLEITGEIGYKTGSIEFPGDVFVKGEIKEGFHIWAGKSVTADRTVDVSQIYCRGAFHSTGGIIGRGKALLRAGGPVTARFSGNCHVESKSNIHIVQYVYQSYVACLGACSTEKNGRIIGGVVTAQDGVRCRNIGNPAGVRTVICVGTDFVVERKLRLNREKHQKITLKLQRLTAKVGDDPTDRQLDILYKLENSRNVHAKALGELTEVLDRNESAVVVASGDVFPGVHIQICRAQYEVTEKHQAVVFRLDKESGRVVCLPLKNAEDRGVSPDDETHHEPSPAAEDAAPTHNNAKST